MPAYNLDMCVTDVMRSQFGAPSGALGSLLVGPFLQFTNRRLIEATIELLDPGPEHCVLDVGFGPGDSLLSLAKKARRVVGVDHSHDMVDAARRKAAAYRNVRVEWGDVARLRFRARTFERAMTVNAIYYWPDLSAGLCEIRRVLKPGGRLAIGFRSPLNLLPFTIGWQNFTLYEPEQVADAMRAAGFRVLQVIHRDRWRIPDTVVVVGARLQGGLALASR